MICHIFCGVSDSPRTGQDMEVFVSYQEYEYGLRELLQGLTYVPGTFPPVYMLGSMLISFDKLGRVRVIETVGTHQTKNGWTDKLIKPFIRPVSRFIRYWERSSLGETMPADRFYEA